jgi:glycosyltransferase involved in cell wall biosynthesis
MKFFKKNLPLAVVTTITNWNEPPRFRHQVTRQLTRFYNVLYVELTQSNRHIKQYEQINDHLIIYRPPRVPQILLRFYARLQICHNLVDWITQKKIERLVKSTGYSTAVLVNFKFDFNLIMSSRIFFPKVYLCNDEFPNQAPRQWQRRLFSKYENRVIKKSDICFVHSDSLYKKFITKHKNVNIILPGHEFKLDKFPETEKLQKLPKKQIAVCYMGYIDKRIVLEWLIEVLSHKNLSLHFIGPVKKSIDISPLFEFSNFELAAPIEGDALQTALQGMDVCVIPFDIKQEVVKACMPNKLFQYIACGKPVVVSNMESLVNLIQLPRKFIYVAKNEKEFVNCILQASRENTDELTRERVDLAKKNSWNARGDQLQLTIDSYVKSRNSSYAKSFNS